MSSDERGVAFAVLLAQLQISDAFVLRVLCGSRTLLVAECFRLAQICSDAMKQKFCVLVAGHKLHCATLTCC